MSGVQPSGSPPDPLLRFIDRFDRGEYWLAHEELEARWLEDRRDLYKGLIHMAAALLHAERGNWRGAAAKATTARGLLEADHGPATGLDPSALRRAAARLQDGLCAVRDGLVAPSRRVAAPRLAELYSGPLQPGITRPRPLPYRVRRHEEGYRTGRDPKERG